HPARQRQVEVREVSRAPGSLSADRLHADPRRRDDGVCRHRARFGSCDIGEKPPTRSVSRVPHPLAGMMAIYVVVLVLAIVYAVRAGGGGWGGFPVIGEVAGRGGGGAAP